DSSLDAAQAFKKVSDHADVVINSFHEISGNIEKMDEQMQQIKNKTNETSSAAEEISSYCRNLADKQRQVSNEVDIMNSKFLEAISGIRQIKAGTSDIVDRIKNVSDASKESYKNMTDLENVLEEFKTTSEVEEAEQQANEENAIATGVLDAAAIEAKALEDAAANEFLSSASNGDVDNAEEIDFNIDEIEEYIPD
ncbi:MAG: hypothetical protein MJ162_07655, partial [Treponema sp.]|nr:hypothetical protein [Treponema sp.]